MKQKIKDEIEKFLENNHNYDHNFLKIELEKIFSNLYKNGDVYGYNITCDNSNNFRDIDNRINIDIFLRENRSIEYTINNIIVVKNKIKELRLSRKEKINKIYGI